MATRNSGGAVMAYVWTAFILFLASIGFTIAGWL